MHPASIVQLPTASRDAPAVHSHADRIVVERLTLVDDGLAHFVGQRPEEDRAVLVTRALRIGLLCLQDTGVSMDVDFVRHEFGALMARTEAANDKAALALDAMLRQNFADGDGRLPRTLERFLGDRGQLRTFVDDLFDEGRRDSAIGRMKTLLGGYFDGDASRLALLLDPTRLGSPLHQFRTEISDGFAKIHDRLTAMEAAGAGRAGERLRSAAKGTDFEDKVESLLGDLSRGSGDMLDRTGGEQGSMLRSKKGDFLLTLGTTAARGSDVRIVIECKDRPVSARAMREELEAAKRNRDACVALVILSEAHAPAGIAPFDMRNGDVYCVLNADAPDQAVLEAAVRLARLLALTSRREREAQVDTTAVRAALDAIRVQFDALRALKVQLSSIGKCSQQVSEGLDKLRDAVLARVIAAEAELVSQPGGQGV